MSSTEPGQGKLFGDAEDTADRRRPALLIDAADVEMALQAGFTKEEVAFMLDLAKPAPDANVDGDGLGPSEAYAIRVVK